MTGLIILAFFRELITTDTAIICHLLIYIAEKIKR